jgi:hypothetical protein
VNDNEPRELWPVLLLALASCLSPSCKDRPKKAVSEAPVPAPPAPDRLAPGQLLEGDQVVFGLRLPERTRLAAVFRDSLSAEGPYSPEDLAAYLKPRLDVAHVEMAGARILFPRARIRGAKADIYRVELIPSGQGTTLRLRNITPPPAEQGLSEAERWRRVGLTPSGELIDPHGLE